MTPMLGEIAKEILRAQPDLDIVGEVPRDISLVEAVEQGRADVVIVEADRVGFPEAWLDLLEGRPDVKLIALLAHGRQAAVFRALTQSSLEDLLDVVRHEPKPP